MRRSDARDRGRRSLAAIAAAVILAISMGAASPAAGISTVVEMTPALKARIQAEIEAFRALHNISGITAAVVTPHPNGIDPVITTFAAGEPSFGSGTSVDASTQFEIGSETKAFTGDLLAYLIADGQVTLDDLVQDYAPIGITVPEYFDPGTGISTPITLRDLATHQSGLPDEPANFADGCIGVPGCVNPRPGYTQTMLWDGIQSQLLLWQPGTNYLYSNWAFGLLGTILSNKVNPVVITDPPAYQITLDHAFLTDLGMSSTMLEPPVPTIATPYSTTNVPTFFWENTNAVSGAGGLISNATDMGTWVAAHLGYNTAGASLGVQSMQNSLQPASTITTYCASAGSCTPENFQMGFAWQLYDASHAKMGAPWAFKNGGTAGSSSDTVMAVGLRMGVTTMFNQQRNGSDEIAATILRLLVAESKRLPETGSGAPDVLLLGLSAAALMVAGVGLIRRRRPGVR